jgi:hypothetical protein
LEAAMNSLQAQSSSSISRAIDRALRRVAGEIEAGLQHGYFEYTISAEVIGQGRRRLQLRAGKNYQFVIPAEECESAANDFSDLRDEGATDSER